MRRTENTMAKRERLDNANSTKTRWTQGGVISSSYAIVVLFLLKLRKNRLMKLSITQRVLLIERDLYPFGAPEFTPCSRIRVARFLIFCVVFCGSLFVICLLSIVLSVLLRFTASDYPYVIFKLFLIEWLYLGEFWP
jgi:hypothetical protein